MSASPNADSEALIKAAHERIENAIIAMDVGIRRLTSQRDALSDILDRLEATASEPSPNDSSATDD